MIKYHICVAVGGISSPRAIYDTDTSANFKINENSRRMRKLFQMLLLLLLAGCGGNLLLIDKNNQESVGSYNSLNQTLAVKHKGKLYSGFYITNESVGIGSAQMIGSTQAYGTSMAYFSGNSGRASLRSADGDTIQCEFNYQDSKAIGDCVDSAGEKYQLITR